MLFLGLLTMSMLLGVLVLALARGERKSVALRLWGWGLVIYAIGLMVILSGQVLPRDLTQILGNSLISLATLLTALGVFRHTKYQPGRGLAVGSLALVMIILIVNHSHLFTPIRFLDVLAPTLYATVAYISVSWLLLRQPPAAAKAAAKFLVSTILLTLLVWNARMALVWFSLRGTTDPARANTIEALFSVAQMVLLVSSTLGMLWVEVRFMEDDLKRSAFTDLLTGLPNRRAMHLRFDEEVARCRRQRQNFGLVLFDIDLFKQINDTCGHYVGDAVLKHISGVLDKYKRGEDVLGRIGGEEFLVILPQHSREECIRAAERLRKAVEGARSHEESATPTATVSGGVAIFPEDGDDWDRLYMAADRRMYRAKRAGRNRVEGRDE